MPGYPVAMRSHLRLAMRGGRPRHEIVFVFDARFGDPSWYLRDELPVTEAGAGWEAARWISVAALACAPERLVPDGLLSLLVAEIGREPRAGG